MTSTCALINYFNDEDMLRLQVESGQLARYDRVYIFDGPYAYTENLALTRTSDRRLIDSEWGAALLKDPRFVYDWRVYDDEREKRVKAYERCDADIIVLHDTDEFYATDAAAFDAFIASPACVGFFVCQNLFLDGVVATRTPLRSADELPWKAYAFKKSLMGAAEHLDYLWLIGVAQNKPDWERSFRKPLAAGYHLTQMRTPAGQQQKYLFYTSLHDVQAGGRTDTGARGELEKLASTGEIDAAEARNIYLRGVSGFTAAPDPASGMQLQKRFTFSPELEEVVARAAEIRHRFEPATFLLWKWWGLHAYVEANRFASVRLQPGKGRFSLKAHVYRWNSPEREVVVDTNLEETPFELDIPVDAHGVLLTVFRLSQEGDNVFDSIRVDAVSRGETHGGSRHG